MIVRFAHVCNDTTADDYLYLQMRYLNLSYNRICDDGATSLSAILHKLQTISLSFCQIGEIGMESIADAIIKRKSPVCEILFYNA